MNVDSPAVAFSRIYLGALWLSDVVASILLGSLAILLLPLSVERLLRTASANAPRAASRSQSPPPESLS